MKPTPALRKIVAGYPSEWAAARAFEVDFKSLSRFLRGKGNLSAEATAFILHKTKLSFEELFTLEAEKDLLTKA